MTLTFEVKNNVAVTLVEYHPVLQISVWMLRPPEERTSRALFA